MNKIARMGITAAVIVAAAGGSYAAYAAASRTPDSSSTAETEITSSPSPSITETATPTDSPTPSPTASTTQYTAVPDADAIFLKAMHADGTLLGITIPSDSELLADGQAACDQLAAGVAFDNVKVIADNPNPVIVQGIPVGQNNSAPVADIASETLCTEYSIHKVPVTPPVNPTH